MNADSIFHLHQNMSQGEGCYESADTDRGEGHTGKLPHLPGALSDPQPEVPYSEV